MGLGKGPRAPRRARSERTRPKHFVAVLTNDTDLVEPIRIITEENLRLPVTLLTPIAKPLHLAREAAPPLP